MHPALSVILFTCVSGGGYMLLAIMGLLSGAGLLPPDRSFGLSGFALGLGAVALGLISSTFHLGHPERAWRALSQWRSSWLSREGILALVTFVPGIVFAWTWLVDGHPSTVAAIATSTLAIATIGATAMIYASLKPVRAWNNGWTVPMYMAHGACSGGLWIALLAGLCGTVVVPMLALIATIAAITSGVVLLLYWRHIDHHPISESSGSATGLGQFGPALPFLSPHTEENYLMKEMGFRIARKHSAKLRSVALWSGIILPGVLALGAGYAGYSQSLTAASWLLAPAVLLNAFGTLVQRWLFFAEARHTVMHYYRARAQS